MSPPVVLLVLEWAAAALTIYGAWLLANKGKHESWGFVLFLAANALWISFAWLQGHTGMLVQQLVLTAISLQGIRKGLIEPLRTANRRSTNQQKVVK